MVVLFWVCGGLILFSLFGYGLLWVGLASLFPQRKIIAPERPVRATVLIAARNEAESIAAKIDSLLAQEVAPHSLDILVVSDGSEDRTVEEAKRSGSSRVRVLDLDQHRGKAASLNHGLTHLDCDVVIFSDANSFVVPGSVASMLRHFGDPTVGGVCGRPETVKKGGWLAIAERLFWHYDNALKAAESRIAGAVSAQGTLYAIRRELVDRIPAAMADDLVVSLAVVAKGHRLVFEPGAVAREVVSHQTGGEFGRRVRSTERGWRGLLNYAELLNPAKHSAFAVQLFCHKILRWLTAFLLPAFFIASLAAAPHGDIYFFFAAAQLLGYSLALLAIVLPTVRKIPGASLAAFFVMGHAAIALGIIRAAYGVRSERWSPVRDLTS